MKEHVVRLTTAPQAFQVRAADAAAGHVKDITFL
jgi:hypothetical protein